MTQSHLLLPLVMLGMLSATTVIAKGDIYKWVDKDGVTHYGSEQPSKDAKPAELPQLQTYKSTSKKVPLGTLESSSKPKPLDSAAGDTTAVREIRITSPAPEETLRDNSVAISASVVPGTPAGAGFVFYLDGKRQNDKALPAPAYTIANIERGSHSVVVAGVDASGREFKRSAAVTFNSKPPIAINGPNRAR